MFTSNLRLYDVNLSVHDDGGAAAAGGDSGQQAAGGNAASEIANRNKSTGASNDSVVLYGKQDSPAAGENDKTSTQHTQPEEKKSKFREMIAGEYKNEFTEYFQETFNSRFKDHKATQEAISSLTPVLETLGEKYGVKDPVKNIQAIADAVENDSAIISQLADEAGMSEEQYKQFRALQRENEQLRIQTSHYDEYQQAQQQRADWIRQAEEMRTNGFPDFDLQTEINQNQQFTDMLCKGIPVDAAYKATHFNELVSGVAGAVGRRVEQNITQNIAAKGRRPTEGGAAAPPGVVIKDDPSQYTMSDLRAVADRVRRGEKVRF